MIVISDDLFLSTPPGVDLNAPVIGWRNSLTAGNVSADSSDVNFPASNVANPSTYLKWKSTTAAMQHVEVAFSAPTLIDYVAIVGHNFGTGEIAASVEGALATDATQKVMLHLNGLDAATSIVDSNVGGSAHTWTANGNAQIDTGRFKLGGSALLLDGTGDYVTTPDHADFNLAALDFTIDCWFFIDPTDGAGGTQRLMAGQVDSAASAASLSFFLERQASNTVRALVGVGAGNVAIQSVTTYTGTTNPGWHHFAVTREGTALRLFIDGVHVATQTLAGTVNNSAAALSVGRAGEITSATWLGSIDEFRILVGRAAWTEGFIPEAFEYDQWDWELLGDEQLPADNQPIIWRFAEETLMAVRLRMTPSYEPPEIAVMYTDVLLELERRIYVGHRVLQYNRRANIVTGFSDEATFLGRIVLGELNESSLDLKNITPQFFRTDMEPWLRNSTERPFFFAWRPTSYPAEVGFCWLTGDPQMSNMRPNGMVQMSASLRGVS